MGSFDDFLSRPPERPTRLMTTGPKNPYCHDQSVPFVALEPSEWFDVVEVGHDRKKVQVRDLIWRHAFGDPAEPREYRGYGIYYLKDGRTLAKRGKAEFVWIPERLISAAIRERLAAQCPE